MELQTLDQQLKVAIQNHQILVAKMKSDPQNGNLQKMLHDLQSQIRTLSERQKQIVQQLRKDLEIKKQQATTGSSIGNSNNNHSTVNSLPQQVVPMSLAMKQGDSPRFTTILLPAKVTLGPASTMNGNEQKQVVTLTTAILPANATPTAIIYRPNTTQETQKTAIRVPQYPPQQPPPPHLTPVLVTNNTPINSPNITTVAHNNNVLKSINNIKTHHKNHDYHQNAINEKEKAKLLDPDAQKKKFMAALGLITHDMMTVLKSKIELKSRKSERKRRTTANPQFSYGNWDNHHMEKKTHYLASPLPSGFKRPRGRPRLGSSTPSGSRPSTPEDINGSSDQLNFAKLLQNGLLKVPEENVCIVCRSKGDTLTCSVCLFGYHLQCIQQSPINNHDSENNEQWTCPNCLLKKKKNSDWPRSLAVVHNFILTKTAKDEERRLLIQRGEELRLEHEELEKKSTILLEQISSQEKARKDLMVDTKQTLESIERLKTSIRVLQTA